jgi:very-short-patch-repair endonuclease
VEKAQSWRNKIDRKSADFVLCNKDFSVVAVVEFDDSSHGRSDRRSADADKDTALKSAGIRIIRWNTKAMPDEGTIRSSVIGGSSVTQTQPIAI